MGRAKQDVTYIRMMHYTGTLPTFARFLRRELYVLSANRNISSWDFPDHPRGSVTHFANSTVQPAWTVSQSFIFVAATAWIVITSEKAVHVSRARRPASDRKGGHLRVSRLVELQRQVSAARDREMLLNKVSRRKSGRKGQISAAYSVFCRSIISPPEDAEERLKLPKALSKASTLRIMAHFVNNIVHCVNLGKSWSLETSGLAIAR